jgi:protein O-GlcNAc transferase
VESIDSAQTPPSRPESNHALSVTHFNEALYFHTNGNDEKAIEHYQKALHYQPDFVYALSNLGTLLHQAGALNSAEKHYRHALSLAPQDAITHVNLAYVLNDQNNSLEAFEHSQCALTLNPNLVGAYIGMGQALDKLNRFSAAIECFQKALSMCPNDAKIHYDLGVMYQAQGDFDNAIESYCNAIQYNPNHPSAYNNLLYTLSMHEHCPVEQYLKSASLYNQHLLETIVPYPTKSELSPDLPLRVGLVSGDFKNHPVGYFLETLLAQLNPNTIELVAYSTRAQEDELSLRIKPLFSAWHCLANLDDAQAAHKIHLDGIHILIDLSGHSGGNRLPVFAYQAAPVQVSWLGYWASTGLSAMDYVLADSTSVPVDQQANFSEKVWYLPHSRLCFSPPHLSLQVNPELPATRNGHFTFGCFQQQNKITNHTIALWAKILNQAPNTRLRIQNRSLACPEIQQKLLDQFKTLGIDAQRLSLFPASTRESYLAAHQDIDCLLDTYPFPGGTTTCEALWMGVPTITLAGKTMLSRQGASLLTCVGLSDFVMDNEDSYVRCAVDWSNKTHALALLRPTLRQRLLRSPLCDAKQFARHLEQALLGVWNDKMKTSLVLNEF